MDDWISSALDYLQSQVNWETIVTNSVWGIIILICLLARKAIRNGAVKCLIWLKASATRLLTMRKRHRIDVLSRPQIIVAGEIDELLDYSNNSLFKIRLFFKGIHRGVPSIQITETEITSGTDLEYKKVCIPFPMDVAWDFTIKYLYQDYKKTTTGSNENILELYASRSSLVRLLQGLRSRSLHKSLSSTNYMISPRAFILSLKVDFELKGFGKRRIYMPINLPDNALSYRGMQEKLTLQTCGMDVYSEIFKDGIYSSDATGFLFVAQSGEKHFPIVGYDSIGEGYHPSERVFVGRNGLVLIQELDDEVNVLKLSKKDLATFKSTMLEWGLK